MKNNTVKIKYKSNIPSDKGIESLVKTILTIIK